MKTSLLPLATVAILFSAPPLLAGTADERTAVLQGHASVVDGDTLRLGPLAVRLHGIDAPEQGQDCKRAAGGVWPCGQVATTGLAELADGQAIDCRPIETDHYGRIVAKCFLDGQDLGERLVESGLAWAFTRYSDDYVAVETRARVRGEGIWQAEAQPAWVFRADRWARAAADAPDHCPIKGNINRKGERIYHTPWSPAYAKTKIDTDRGERWFCDEAEAVAAGWRASRWR